MNDNSIIQDLIDEKIVSLSLDKPFKYASGILSPIYTDLRLTISYPSLRAKIADGLVNIIKNKYPDVTVIGGVVTAGIPHATLVAEKLGLPLIYVRSKPKDHGAGKQTEGRVTKDDKVLLIDDLISTGGSVLGAAKALQRDGINVAGIISIFTYEFPDATNNFAKAGINFESLLKYSDLINKGYEEKQFNDQQFEKLNSWHQDAWAWTKKEQSND
ncbi:orotate phosphoribosyltransferase [Lactobacillus sp. S2-2]|uniref:orotate phosphoribosyltransferase n=1 Tax=Lactobacillus sp. S2-2 TaxID=2692917 RepID=UPI001F0013DD|nr:orotate phosphoribosyltransferase [Lactobacillus sp. S2-2]MCF6514918.1 orotate phosphoribosyltransferase [Lactobacillus sp. S2-2]